MSVPTEPPTVNTSHLTIAHHEQLQQARERALEAYAVATANADHAAAQPGTEESRVA